MRMRTVASVDRYTLCSWPRHRRCHCFSRTLIAAIVIDGRPVRHGRWQRRREIREVAGSVHRFASEQRQHRRDVLDLLFRHTEVVIRQHREICELPYLDLTLLAALAGEPGVRFGPQALRLLTEANTWFSGEGGKKGQIKVGQLADLAVLSDDYFSVPEEKIEDITSVLTLLGGRPVHASGDFSNLAPPLPSAMPDWSPVNYYGGYQSPAEAAAAAVAGPAAQRVAVHRCHGAHPHTRESALWGDFGCACWAF